MNAPLRAGMIGLGSMGRNHARVLGLLPGTVIVHAIEGACFNPGSPPSDAVRTAAETLAETLLAGL